MTNYLNTENKYYSSYSQLLGKTFKVLSVSPPDPKLEICVITLEDINGKQVYYKYLPTLYDGPDYPFEVIGGLDLPADFYCDNVEENKQGNQTIYRTGTGGNVIVSREIEKGKPDIYMLVIKCFIEANLPNQKTGTLVLDNNKTIAFHSTIMSEYHDGTNYKYSFGIVLNPKEVELIKTNKILGVKIADKLVAFTDTEKTQGVINCIAKK